jgi:acetylornithine deacetylase/succinyl-diaminopimelate desuccinylase-like protein
MDNLERIIELAIAIQQIPAPTFHEQQRAEFVRSRFMQEGLLDVEMDPVGNVYGRIPGTQAGSKPLVVSAHLDTVFPMSVELKCEREGERVFGPGIGDNSLSVAALVGLLWQLQEEKASLPGDVWLAANVGEEGLGDLKGMRAVVERFGGNALAYIVVEGMALGTVYNRGLGVRRYRVQVQTEGGHSWLDYGKPSAIHELTSVCTRLSALEMPRKPRTTFNIGVISGGSSVNTIAAEAMVELDLRSEKAETLDATSNKVLQWRSSGRDPLEKSPRGIHWCSWRLPACAGSGWSPGSILAPPMRTCRSPWATRLSASA